MFYIKTVFSKTAIREKRGSALILTMFILAGMLIVSLGGAYVVFLGIKAGGIQAQSTRAYYAAESGTERLLWELRWNSASYSSSTDISLFNETLSTGGNYDVYYVEFPPLVFRSIGEFQNSKRSVEIRI